MKSSYSIKDLKQKRKFGYYLYSHQEFKKKGVCVLRNRYMRNLGIPDCNMYDVFLCDVTRFIILTLIHFCLIDLLIQTFFSFTANLTTKFPAYERVTLRDSK